MNDESPWALQLVARVEKLSPPTAAAICKAATLATLALLDDDRSEPGGEWHEAVSTWNGVRIRKIVRRARGAAWERAQTPDGVTVTVDGAEVRAYVPSRMNDAPAEIAKLQIKSTALDPVDTAAHLPSMSDGTLAIAVTPRVEMSWGKYAAQCAHAGQLLMRVSHEASKATWNAEGRPVAVLFPDGLLWDRLVAESAVARVHDAGFTEVPPDTNTAIAWWA